MRSPKIRGELSEMDAMLALMRAGYTVLTAPFTACVRYDCVLDDGGRFLRVQIKTGRLSGDGRSILFATASNNGSEPGALRPPFEICAAQGAGASQ